MQDAWIHKFSRNVGTTSKCWAPKGWRDTRFKLRTHKH